MMDVKTDGGVAVLTMTHGKANALDIEFCDALAARLTELARGRGQERSCSPGRGRCFPPASI